MRFKDVHERAVEMLQREGWHVQERRGGFVAIAPHASNLIPTLPDRATPRDVLSLEAPFACPPALAG